MSSAEGTASFGKKALTLEVTSADCALETVRMPILGERLHPSITGRNRELTAHALGGEEIIPVLLTVGIAILQIERAVSKRILAVGAGKTIRMPLLVESIQTVPFDSLVAFVASRGKVRLVAVLAVKTILLFHESVLLEGALAESISAHKVVWTPGFVQSHNVLATNGLTAMTTKGNHSPRELTLQQSSATPRRSSSIGHRRLAKRRILP